MKLIRMEDIKLCKLIRVPLLDGDIGEDFEDVKTYKGMVQYHLGSDEVAAAAYGADIDTIQRIATIHNELEQYLLPLVHNKEDNVSKYVIVLFGNAFSIRKVTPKYIDIGWR